MAPATHLNRHNVEQMEKWRDEFGESSSRSPNITVMSQVDFALSLPGSSVSVSDSAAKQIWVLVLLVISEQ